MKKINSCKKGASRSGHSIVERVWEKGRPAIARDDIYYRKDEEGNLIRRASYGTRGRFGWQIDRINGGGGNLANLRPLHWIAIGKRRQS